MKTEYDRLREAEKCIAEYESARYSRKLHGPTRLERECQPISHADGYMTDKIILHYTQQHDSPIPRPYIVISVKLPGQPLEGVPTFAALLDSGADKPFSPFEIAERLGLRKEDCKKGNRPEDYYHAVEIYIAGRFYLCEATFTERQIECPALGRDGVFEHFRIMFDHKYKMFMLWPWEAETTGDGGGPSCDS